MKKTIIIVTKKASVEENPAGGSRKADGEGRTADGVTNETIGARKIFVALN